MHTGAVMLLLALAALLPSSLGHRIGARANESCYGHEIDHSNPENPPAFKQDCVGNCNYDLTLIAKVCEDFSQEQTQVTDFTCGGLYQCKCVPVVRYKILLL